MKRYLVIFISFLLILAIFPAVSYAADIKYPFSVNIILPENNIDQKGYYHVQGQPGETIELRAIITNLTDQPIEVSAVPLNAYSGPDGIFYQNPDSVNSQAFALIDESYGMAQYMDTQKILNIAPKDEVTATVSLAVPDINAGTLLGGIRYALFAGTQKIQNEDAGSTAILIDEYLAIDTAIQIDLPGTVQSSLAAGKPNLSGQYLNIPIVNQSATIEKDVFGIYEIRDSSNCVLLMGNITLPKMAPMTGLQLLEPWDESWKAGEYNLYVQLRSNGQPIIFKQTFSVGESELPGFQSTQQDSKTVQAAQAPSALNAPDTAPSQKIISGFVIGTPVLVSIILLLLFKKNRKREKIIRNMTGKRYVKTNNAHTA